MVAGIQERALTDSPALASLQHGDSWDPVICDEPIRYQEADGKLLWTSQTHPHLLSHLSWKAETPKCFSVPRPRRPTKKHTAFGPVEALGIEAGPIQTHGSKFTADGPLATTHLKARGRKPTERGQDGSTASNTFGKEASGEKGSSSKAPRESSNAHGFQSN